MTNLTKSTRATKEKEIKREWYLFDANKKVLGRFSSSITYYLIGKHKSNYVAYLDMGDNVIVINAKDIVLTGKKQEKKTYSRYSGYPGGLKTISFGQLKEKNPTEIIKRAIMGMLPKNKFRDRRITRLHIFEGKEHNYDKNLKIKIENINGKKGN